jgi:hypothetical protein
MSKRHVFLALKETSWQNFNILTFGLDEGCTTDAEQEQLLAKTVTRMEAIAAAAFTYAKAYDADHVDEGSDWANNLGLFVHVYPYTNDKVFLLHVLDSSFVGPTFHHLADKNMDFEECLAVVTAEWRDVQKRLPKTNSRFEMGIVPDVADAEASAQQLEKSRRRGLYGLSKRASPSRPLLRLMTEESWAIQFRQFPANKSATMSEGSRRQLDVIQLHVDHILKYSKNGNDPVVEAEKFLDSLRLPTEVRSLVRTEKPMSLEECARKHEAVLIARYGDAKPMI